MQPKTRNNLGTILEQSWSNLGAPKTLYFIVKMILEQSWSNLIESWSNLGAILEQSWSNLGAPKTLYFMVKNDLGVILEQSTSILEQSNSILEQSWSNPEASRSNPGAPKTLCFTVKVGILTGSRRGSEKLDPCKAWLQVSYAFLDLGFPPPFFPTFVWGFHRTHFLFKFYEMIHSDYSIAFYAIYWCSY